MKKKALLRDEYTRDDARRNVRRGVVVLREREYIAHIEPWTAAGPGWSNAGITVELAGHYREKAGKLVEDKRTITLYRNDLGVRSMTLWPHAHAIMGDLRKALLSEHFKEARK
jgi:hypothetical protein